MLLTVSVESRVGFMGVCISAGRLDGYSVRGGFEICDMGLDLRDDLREV